MSDAKQTDPSKWTVAEVGTWVWGLPGHLRAFHAKFVEQSICGSVLLDLNDEDFVELGLTTSLQRKAMKGHIEGLKTRVNKPIQIAPVVAPPKEPAKTALVAKRPPHLPTCEDEPEYDYPKPK